MPTHTRARARIPIATLFLLCIHCKGRSIAGLDERFHGFTRPRPQSPSANATPQTSRPPGSGPVDATYRIISVGERAETLETRALAGAAGCGAGVAAGDDGARHSRDEETRDRERETGTWASQPLSLICQKPAIIRSLAACSAARSISAASLRDSAAGVASLRRPLQPQRRGVTRQGRTR